MTSSPAIFKVGTLVYDRRSIVVLFFWLMWNDFSLMLIEQIGNLNGFVMRDLGASMTEMALLGLPFGLIGPFINPIVSTWSDRLRGPYGRRRPFLFWATPPFAFFLAATPFMPDFYHYLAQFPVCAAVFSHLPVKGEVLFVSLCASFMGLCNAVVLAIFSYLYMDVVPESHMGRFQSLSKNASVLAGLAWSFCIFGFATDHLKAVYVLTSVFCLAVYMISVWQIKEGEYPPPDKHVKGGPIAPVVAYAVECFSRPYYLWIFFASFLFQLGNCGGYAQSIYLHYELKLDFWAMGWANGWGQTITTGFGLLCGFAIGTYTDKVKGVTLIGPFYMILALVHVAATYYVVDTMSLMIYSALVGVLNFAGGITIGAFTIEVFPREKLGQFCSAQAFSYQMALTVLSPLVGAMFDHLHNFRLGYLWTGTCFFLAGIVYIKVYLNWKRCGGNPPVPHSDKII